MKENIIKTYADAMNFEYFGGNKIYTEINGNEFFAEITDEIADEIDATSENDYINIELEWILR